MKIFLLIGLPGSGKTHWLKNKQGTIFDDMSQIKNGMEKLKELIQNNSKTDNQQVYIADVNFCEIVTLEKAKNIIISFAGEKEIEFKYILFISTKDISINNVEYRQDGRNVIPTIKRFANKIDIVQDYLLTKYSENTECIRTPIMTIRKIKTKKP